MFSFKYSYLGITKTFIFSYLDSPQPNFDKRFWKVSFVPYDHYMKNIADKCLNDFNENNLIDNLKYIVFFSIINEKIFKKFGSVTLPLIKVYDLLHSEHKVFVFLKD